MLKKIEALRLQPKHIRNRYAFWSALTITLVIVSIWILTSVVSKNVPATTTVAEDDVESSFLRAWHDLKTTAQASFAQFRTQTTYEQGDESAESVEQSNIIDLDALLASSSPHRLVPTSTATTNAQVATKTEPIATSTER